MYLPLLIFEVYDIAQFYLVYPLLVFYNQAFSVKTVQLFAGLYLASSGSHGTGGDQDDLHTLPMQVRYLVNQRGHAGDI